jgi:hypothetical protein
MKKIIFIDSQNENDKSFHLDRQEFYKTLKKDYKIQVVENISENDNSDIVFIHQSYFGDSNLMISSSERNELVKDSVFVFYGNNSQEKLDISEKEVSYFNFYVLHENFKAFHKELSQSRSIEDSSWQTLLGIDPKLEELLKYFENQKPVLELQDPRTKKEFKEHQAKLWAYLNLS